MVKKGGTKRKISIEKITKKESLATTFTKRTYGLYSKASQLCLLSDAQIAILATPPSSESNTSFYSFGHSSVETLVDAYLTGQRPPVPLSENKYTNTREDVGVCMSRNNLGLGFWWDDDKLNRSENPQELKEAMESMAALLKSVKKLNSHVVNDNNQINLLRHHQDEEELVVHATQEQEQTLYFKFDFLPAHLNNDQACFNNEDLNKNDVVLYQGSQEQDQALNFESNSAIYCVPDDDLPSNFNNITEEQAQIFTVCQSFYDTDNNINSYMNALTAENLGGECSNEKMDIEQLIDYDMIPQQIIELESSLEAAEDRAFVFQNCATNLVQDNGCFSNVFN